MTRERSRWARRVALVLAVGFVLVAAATARLFVWPPTSRAPTRADAVMLLSGGRGDRLPVARALVERGVADVLVIPHGERVDWPDARALCLGRNTFEVVCPTPSPDSTQGEARALASLARDRGWKNVVVVTSRYHMTRARIVVPRCTTANIHVVGSTSSAGLFNEARHVAHEWGGLVHALVLQRRC